MSGTMADQNVAPRNAKRLTRRNPGARLARDLLKTEYGLRGQDRSGAGRTDGEGIWERLAAELRRLLARFTGGSRPAPAGGGSAPGGQEGGQSDGSFDPAAATAPGGPGQPSPTTPPPTGTAPADTLVHTGMARLEERIRRLPAHERETFENAVLHLVRSDKKYRKAFEKSPESMPLVARCAVNAHLREVAPEVAAADKAARQRALSRPGAPGDETRSRWERPARDLGEPAVDVVPSSSRGSFAAPRPDEMTDGLGFQEAERVSLAERTGTATLTPRESDMFAGHGFLAAQNGSLGLGSGDDTLAPASGREPVSPLPAEAQLVSPVLGDAAPVSPLPAHAQPFSPAPDHASLVSPLPERAVPAPSQQSPVLPPSPLSREGHQSLRDTRDAFPTASTSSGSDATTRSAAPAHGVQRQPVQRPVRRT
ncbi:hypothetical protein ACFYPT_29250 [Streptomyces sp. NPDC005529]|uniref:hypothetical protein n=2 Tax=unclassified Streptomyces TaxID=2593676 RepID=UPI0033B9A3EB